MAAASLSHRPTLITKSIVFWKNAALPVELEFTTFVAMSSAHRAIHLLHGGWRTWQKLAGIYWRLTELLAL